MLKKMSRLFVMLVIISMLLPTQAFADIKLTADTVVNFTILHTNDFHGQLTYTGSNPGAARDAAKINTIRTAKGAENVLLFDGGDMMQGSLLSNLQKGLPVMGYYQSIGYDGVDFGNHEFDWNQTILQDRVTQAANPPTFPAGVDPAGFPYKKSFPYISSNIVLKGTATDCSTITTWDPPAFAQPFHVYTVGAAGSQVTVGVMAVTTQETPVITLAGNTAGLCFRDPADAILHYYDTVKSQADFLVVLSHLGLEDGGYGYGIAVYGDKTLANKLITATKPVNLIIGGHSHTNMSAAFNVPSDANPVTTIVQAYYNGRQVDQMDVVYNLTAHAVTSKTWTKNTFTLPGDPEDPATLGLINAYASDPAYQALINQPIGYAQVDLPRKGGKVDNMMGTFIDDAIYNYLNTDAEPANDIDLFFNNAGGIRTDWCEAPDPLNPGQYIWSSDPTDCADGLWAHDPLLLTYGNMFTVLPFGNATVVGDMTGAQILMVLNQAPVVSNGVIQPAGLKYKYYAYKDALPGPQPFAWGAFDYCVMNKVTAACDPLDLNKTYKVGTNEFLAPAGGDGYGGFKYMTNVTYWGDMLNAVNAYVTTTYGTPANAYKGPNGDGNLDGRILRDGTDTPLSGTIIPITILHHNDSHGNLVKGPYVSYPQLATLITQERAHNPTRTMLLNGGDSIQGDAMMYYFRTAPQGYASDGTPLPPAQSINPIIAAMNAMNYDAFDLGNHEFNFGKDVFVSTFQQATMPILGANVTDSGAYGLGLIPVQSSIEKSFPGATADPDDLIHVGILGLTNHRVPNYELPSNIPGLTFSNPIDKAAQLVPGLKAANDAVIALTHIGFTTNPNSVEVDTNVDTYLAAQVPGIDAIVGSHSHTNPANPEAPYKFLPTIVSGPNNTPVIINQAYRYNNTLGEIIIGMRPKVGGGYEVATRVGQYLSVTMSTAEDPAIKAIIDPYNALLTVYKNKPLGQTTIPLDALKAFTQETNATNLQADASVYELALHGILVDMHISGAMTNKKIADGATPGSPVSLVINDMFTLMPYENSLVVLLMNGPQIKTVLERGYRNYYYYKYVPGYGGYSYYTTCMLDINKGGNIKYAEGFPNGHNVRSLTMNGMSVDFNDPTTFYYVSTVNYLAAGSCNFNNGGVTLWPLSQIAFDTQYYVRDAVIDYVKAQGLIGPQIEGRLQFNWFLFYPFAAK
jgi:5'-nucleotidase